MRQKGVNSERAPSSVPCFSEGRSADDRNGPLRRQTIENGLHLRRHLVVDIVGIRVRPEPLAQLDRRNSRCREPARVAGSETVAAARLGGAKRVASAVNGGRQKVLGLA